MGIGSEKDGGPVLRPASRVRRLAVRLGQGVLGLIAAGLLAWGGLLVALNLPALKGRFGAGVSRAIGAPFTVGHVVATPWGTIALKKLRAGPAPEGSGAGRVAPSISIGELRFEVEPLSLLRRDIQIRSIELSDPVVSLVRSRGEGLIYPLPRAAGDLATAGVSQGGADALPEAVDPSADAGPAAPAEAQPPRAGATDQAASGQQAAKPDTEAPRALPLVIRVGSRVLHLNELSLGGGSLRIVSVEDGGEILRVEGIRTILDVGPDPRKEGRFEAQRALLLGSIEARALRAKMASAGPWVDLTDFEAEVEGGVARGRLRASAFLPGMPFIGALQVDEVPAAPLFARLAPALAIDEGVLKAGVRLLGRLREPSTFQGLGELKIVGGHWGVGEAAGLLPATYGAQAPEGLSFDEMFVRFRVGDGALRVEDVRVGSPDIWLAGRGGITFQGTTRLALRIYLNEGAHAVIGAIEKELPPDHRFGYLPFEGSRERFYRDYLVEGPLDDPLVNFWDPEKPVRARDVATEIFGMIQHSVSE